MDGIGHQSVRLCVRVVTVIVCTLKMVSASEAAPETHSLASTTSASIWHESTPEVTDAERRTSSPGEIATRFRTARELWLHEGDPARKKVLRTELYDTARSIQDEFSAKVFHELELGRSLEEATRALPTSSTGVQLRTVCPLDGVTTEVSWQSEVIFRKVGPRHVEAWTSSTGYLFASDGKLANKARVPRRDGYGREWYGAFLSDGSWATTDLWSNDRQFHIFSSRGHFVRSLRMPCTVARARADSKGTAWVVRSWRVDDFPDCGSHLYHIRRNGVIRDLGEHFASVVPSREVGPMMQDHFVIRELLSDDGSHLLRWTTQAHGYGAMWGNYYLMTAARARARDAFTGDDATTSAGYIYDRHIYQAGDYGFFPRSLQAWIVTSNGTWILEPSGEVQAVFPGQVLGDAADGKSLLLVGEDGRVFTVSPDVNLSIARKFKHAKHGAAYPVALFDEMRLGFFTVEDGGTVLLGKW